ncbi:PREDICTED: interferon regulatory factor 7 [Tinamus guttatus]|uniref:interferon regulatory factor 7 n=1 Tax=Tinamus guttatus TaxID=94827 RepID=UPI00052E765A|nr:PREDICTED: interferon regulatory factor 7 [Tinamus guttatus]
METWWDSSQDWSAAGAAWGYLEEQDRKDWAKASGRYRPEQEDPARWKTNFRCALRSTRRFVRLEDYSNSDEDPHKVYRVVDGIKAELVAPLDPLQWVLQQCELGPEAPGWATAPGSIQPMLDISIFYRCADGALPLGLTWLVRFPSPAGLADHKQRRFTEELLQNTGLLLEQRDNKIFAQRFNNCKVYWALSSQLGADNLSPKVLRRNQETEIFDFTEFCTELTEFRNYRRRHSPDFTIYLCFGQCLSNAKPKDSKLILVKLVPKFCEFWYEQVLREGASSLNSSSLSLQLSNSFSLFELIEQYNMQLD